jgi:hypothetical protein
LHTIWNPANCLWSTYAARRKFDRCEGPFYLPFFRGNE